MAMKLYSDADIQAIADAIRGKNGSSDTYTVSQMAQAIGNIPSGGGGGTTGGNGPVKFFDPYGNLAYSYTADEFLALSAMPADPALPNHLLSQGWNWSLQDAQDYVTTYGHLNVGQMCTTNDGTTKFWIKIPEGAGAAQMQFCLMFAAVGSSTKVEIDWGDGSSPTTHNIGISTTICNHTYSYGSDYCVSCRPIETTSGLRIVGVTSSPGGGTNYTTTSASWSGRIIGVNVGSRFISIGANAFYNCYSLTSITIPDSVTSINSNAFYNCYSLTSITIPDSVTSIGGNALRNCYSLTSITIPDSVTSISNYAFQNCYSLTSITIPDSVTSISNYALRNCHSLTSITIPDSVTSIESEALINCYSLTSITIPDSVTSIGSSAFSNCTSMGEYHFLSETPPTLSDTNAFSGIPVGCVIYVPYSEDHSILEAYKTATNWSTYASYMQEEAA